MNRETIAREPSVRLIVYSFVVAVAINLLPWPAHIPLPDAVAALLVFWAVQAPRKMSLGLAWVLGLVMDAQQGVLLGEHALVYSLLTFGAISLHRRLMGFSVAGQSLHLLGLFLATLLVGALIQWLAEGTPLSSWLVVQSIANTLGWLVAHRILLIILKRRPGRRPVRPPRPRSSMVTETRTSSDFRRRVTVAAIGVAICIGLLGLRLATLQVWQHQDHATKAENNRIALLPMQAPRGLILDRYGEVLARNVAGFSVELEPGTTVDVEPLIEVLTPLLDLTPADIRRFKRELANARKFDPIAFKTKLTDEQVAKVAVRIEDLPGVRIERRPIRAYPYGESSSHLIGHIGRVSRLDQERLEKDGEAQLYSGVTHIGKLGIEKSYETTLKGDIGVQRIEIASSGRIIRELGVKPAVPGRNIQLSVDFGLQQLIEAAYGNRRGAMVAMDPNSGEILAFVSKPNFDPNAFVDGVDPDLWEGLNTSLDKPMLNRALRGIYPPGSTYKPFMALAALASGERNPEDTIQDPGYFMLGSHKFRDSRPEGHGRVDLKKSIVVSSDTYYYKLAMDMGVDGIFKHIAPFGFGRRTGIDMEGEAAGILPSSEWKMKRFGVAWLTGETPSIGIGQGYNAFTMLQLARATAAIANGGKMMRPRLVRAIEDHNGRYEPLPADVEGVLDLRPEWIEFVTQAMVEVNQSGTSARVMAGTPYKVAGKTGTSQVFSVKQDEKYIASRVAERLRDHSLYVAFAPAESPTVAIAVVVENGGFGAAAAAPIARKVLDFLLVTRSQPSNLK